MARVYTEARWLKEIRRAATVYTEARWLKEIRRAATDKGPDVFSEFVARTPIFEAATAIVHTRDDLHDVIEALRALKRYDLSDRLRTLQERLDQQAGQLTAVTFERGGQ